MIMGCMFSGKSTELLRRIRMHRLLGQSVLVVKHSSDKRYGNGLQVVSHDQESESAYNTEKLMIVTEEDLYKSAHVICIDEGQFFEDIEAFVQIAVDLDGKHVIVSCLDGTFERKPFPSIVNLMAQADDYMKLKALCTVCKDGTPACFSKRITDDKSVKLIGGAEAYMCVCRKHFAS